MRYINLLLTFATYNLLVLKNPGLRGKGRQILAPNKLFFGPKRLLEIDQNPIIMFRVILRTDES